MPADADVAARAHDLRRRGRQLGEHVFVLGEPWPTQRFFVQYIVGHKAPHLRILMHLSGLVEIIFRPRAAVSHQQSRRVEDSALHKGLHDILIQGHDRQRVFIAREAIDGVGQIQFQIESLLPSSA